MTMVIVEKSGEDDFVMRKANFNKRRVFLAILQLGIVGVICLGFLKYSEEVTTMKDEFRRKIHFMKTETNVDFTDYPTIAHTEGAWYEGAPLIYHAGGGLSGYNYTNSKEALEETLAEGRRYVEMDFLYTADEQLACAHYWSSLYDDDVTVPTLEEFKEHKIFGKFTTLTAEDLIGYMAEYEDLYIIIDTKEENYVAVIEDLVKLSAFDTSITERFVIQLYEEQVKGKLQQIYPFEDDNFLFTTYKYGTEFENKIMNICYEENIAVIVIPYDMWEKETIDKFREKDFIIYEHTVNRPNQAKVSLEKGISSFYTDYLTESDLGW